MDQLTMEILWTLNMISLSCAFYIVSMALKLMCKVVYYINLIDKKDMQ